VWQGTKEEILPNIIKAWPKSLVDVHVRGSCSSSIHWSAAFYAGLNYLQYKDGCNIVNVNRDNAAGFCLDTMATHRLHKSPVVKGHEVLITYIDYVNPYTSILQTTSYNFTATDTTAEMCAEQLWFFQKTHFNTVLIWKC